jgi:hypothetical protein
LAQQRAAAQQAQFADMPGHGQAMPCEQAVQVGAGITHRMRDVPGGKRLFAQVLAHVAAGGREQVPVGRGRIVLHALRAQLRQAGHRQMADHLHRACRGSGIQRCPEPRQFRQVGFQQLRQRRVGQVAERGAVACRGRAQQFHHPRPRERQVQALVPRVRGGPRPGNTVTYGFSGTPTFSGLTVGGGGAGFTIVNNTVIDMGGNVVGGVADGVAATDAVNKGQLDAGLAAASGSAAAAQAAAGVAQTTADQAIADAAASQTTADTAQASAVAAQASAATAQATADTAQVTADAALSSATIAQATAEAAQDTADTAIVKADAAQATADTALTTATAAVDTANDYTDSREAAIRTDMESGDAATLTSAQAFADAGDAAILSSANAYTDSRFAAWDDSFERFQRDVEGRFAHVDQRIDRMGAMSSAMSAAAMNTAGLPGQNRVGVGVGSQNGRTAMAVGYQRLVAPNASISLGGAFSGNEKGVSAGAGFSW